MKDGMAIRRRPSISDIIDEYFADLEEWVEKFGETLTERPSWNLRNCSIEPLREIVVTPTEVSITVDLPFTSKGTVKVEPVSKNSLEVSAKMKRKIRLDDLGVTHCKGEFQKFHCHMRIPVPVKMDKMDIHYKKGILEIHLPRKH
jgi:HSP20 family molecular chaperone IbpA